MSVSVSSQPSQSGRNSEDEGVDRDGDGYGERDDDGEASAISRWTSSSP